MLSPIKGFLVEYALSLPPLMLAFDFNPQSLTRNRSITLTLGSTPATRGGYDFALPTETARVAQGVALGASNSMPSCAPLPGNCFTQRITPTLQVAMPPSRKPISSPVRMWLGISPVHSTQ